MPLTGIGRVMALDVGDRRIGVAVSDPLRITVRGLADVVERNTPLSPSPMPNGGGGRGEGEGVGSGDDRAVDAIVALVRQWSPLCVVVGDPRLPSGDRGPQAEATDAFMTRLAPALEALGVSIERWDESYTTEAATARLRARGVDTRRNKAAIDAEAAAVILEEWLRAHESIE